MVIYQGEGGADLKSNSGLYDKTNIFFYIWTINIHQKIILEAFRVDQWVIPKIVEVSSSSGTA